VTFLRKDSAGTSREMRTRSAGVGSVALLVVLSIVSQRHASTPELLSSVPDASAAFTQSVEGVERDAQTAKLQIEKKEASVQQHIKNLKKDLLTYCCPCLVPMCLCSLWNSIHIH